MDMEQGFVFGFGVVFVFKFLILTASSCSLLYFKYKVLDCMNPDDLNIKFAVELENNDTLSCHMNVSLFW